MDRWFYHTNQASKNFDTEFIFVIDPNDKALKRIIQTSAPESTVIEVEDNHNEDVRDWCNQRYHHMVFLRNVLLSGVRRITPDYFLSLDSDMLLPPEGFIENLIETIENKEGAIAVGGKAFLAPGVFHPTYAVLNADNNIQREDSVGVFTVDALMAIKLMSPTAYNVDYQFNGQGEDLGWAQNARKCGKLYWDGRITAKHVMTNAELNRVDPRAGF